MKWVTAAVSCITFIITYIRYFITDIKTSSSTHNYDFSQLRTTCFHWQSGWQPCTCNRLKLRQTKYTTGDSCDGRISVLNHSLSWSKFVNTHSRQWFNIHVFNGVLVTVTARWPVTFRSRQTDRDIRMSGHIHTVYRSRRWRAATMAETIAKRRPEIRDNFIDRVNAQNYPKMLIFWSHLDIWRFLTEISHAIDSLYT